VINPIFRRLSAAFVGMTCVLLSGVAGQAATVSITGGSSVTVPLGTSTSDNNVVNFAPSGVTVPGGGTYYGLQCGSPCLNWVTGATVTTTLSNFNLSWYFLGSESGNVNTLSSPTGTVIQTELNQNNNLGSNPPGTLFAGVLTPISTLTNATSFSFTLADTSSGAVGTLTNLLAQTGGSSSFMAAYLNPKIVGGKLVGWDTTSSASDWFAIGYNDPGSTDRDFDDIMAVAHITAVPGPIVGAGLPGLAAAAGLLALLARRRRAKFA